jgi:hypothetical protein
MIDFERAYQIVKEDMQRQCWGMITPDDEDYEAVLLHADGKSAWEIGSKGPPVRDCSHVFLLDAETGKILTARRLGTR